MKQTLLYVCVHIIQRYYRRIQLPTAENETNNGTRKVCDLISRDKLKKIIGVFNALMVNRD